MSDTDRQLLPFTLYTDVSRGRLPELGKIKIGGKGERKISSRGKEFAQPKQLDHFVITTLERDADGNFRRDEVAHRAIGEDAPRELDILLPYSDPALNFPTFFAFYEGKKRRCWGNREKAQWRNDDGTYKETKCPGEQCPYFTGEYAEKLGKNPEQVPRCKLVGILYCILSQVPMTGGVYVFRTHGFYTIQAIQQSLNFITATAHGHVAGLQLKLRFQHRHVERDGRTQRIPFVTLYHPGELAVLFAETERLARLEAGHAQTMEDRQRKALAAGDIEAEVRDGDIAEEFYPEAKEAETIAEPAFDAEPWLLSRRDEIEGLDSSVPELLLEFADCENEEQLKERYEKWWSARRKKADMDEAVAAAAREAGEVEEIQEEPGVEQPPPSADSRPRQEEAVGETTTVGHVCAVCGKPMSAFEAVTAEAECGRYLCQQHLSEWRAREQPGRST